MNSKLSNGTRTSQANGSTSHKQPAGSAEKRPAALTVGDKVYFAGTIVKAQADLHGSQVWVRPADVDDDDASHDHVMNTEFVEHRYSQYYTERDASFLLAAVKQFLGTTGTPSAQEASGALVNIIREWTRLKSRERLIVALNENMRAVMELALNFIAAQPSNPTQQEARQRAQDLMRSAVEWLHKSEAVGRQGVSCE